VKPIGLDDDDRVIQVVDGFRNAPAGTTLNMLGRYMQYDYILASITPMGASSTPGITPAK